MSHFFISFVNPGDPTRINNGWYDWTVVEAKDPESAWMKVIETHGIHLGFLAVDELPATDEIVNVLVCSAANFRSHAAERIDYAPAQSPASFISNKFSFAINGRDWPELINKMMEKQVKKTKGVFRVSPISMTFY